MDIVRCWFTESNGSLYKSGTTFFPIIFFVLPNQEDEGRHFLLVYRSPFGRIDTRYDEVNHSIEPNELMFLHSF